jgi:hypothetical protein
LDCPKPSLSTSVTSPGRGKLRDLGYLVVWTVVHNRWAGFKSVDWVHFHNISSSFTLYKVEIRFMRASVSMASCAILYIYTHTHTHRCNGFCWHRTYLKLRILFYFFICDLFGHAFLFEANITVL